MSQGQDEGMDALSPVMSYDPGYDHLERVESEGEEPKYEGKGKGRCMLAQCKLFESYILTLRPS